jgi:hypothetical protein
MILFECVTALIRYVTIAFDMFSCLNFETWIYSSFCAIVM